MTDGPHGVARTGPGPTSCRSSRCRRTTSASATTRCTAPVVRCMSATPPISTAASICGSKPRRPPATVSIPISTAPSRKAQGSSSSRSATANAGEPARPISGRRSTGPISRSRPGCASPGSLIEKGRAVGVEYLDKARLQTAHAVSEVVLTSGAIGSCHLLLLSGIGPADELEGRRGRARA